MAQNPTHHHWTVDAYLAFEAQSDVKYEYIDGQIYPIFGSTDQHSLIATNTTTEIGCNCADQVFTSTTAI